MLRRRATLAFIAALLSTSCSAAVTPGGVPDSVPPDVRDAASADVPDAAPVRVWCDAWRGVIDRPDAGTGVPFVAHCPAAWTCYAGRGPNPGFSGPWCCPEATRGDSGPPWSIDPTGCCGPNGTACPP